jgi:hypothetical protein
MTELPLDGSASIFQCSGRSCTEKCMAFSLSFFFCLAPFLFFDGYIRTYLVVVR